MKQDGKVLNTEENAERAFAAAYAALPKLTAGAVWAHTSPHGEPEIKGALLYDGKPTVILHFSTEDGNILPRGLHSYSPAREEIIAMVKSNLSGFPAKLSVLEGAEFREPEFCWAFPVVYKGRIVGHIKVAAQGENIVPDKKAQEEISR